MDIKYMALAEFPRALTKERKESQFKAKQNDTERLLDKELTALKAREIVLQVDVHPRDIRRDGLPRSDARYKTPAVILSFVVEGKGTYSFPCDRFNDLWDNIRGIALSLQALRAVDRYGVTQSGEQFAGMLRIAQTTAETAASFIAQETNYSAEEVMKDPEKRRAAFIERARILHPDRSGDSVQMAYLNLCMSTFPKDRNVNS